MLTIKSTDKERLVSFFTDFCANNDINLPEPATTAAIIHDMGNMWGTQKFENLQFAFRNWQMGAFKQIRKPRNLNLHFIGEVMREHQAFTTGGGKMHKEAPKRKIERREWTTDEMEPIYKSNIRYGFEDFRATIYQKKKPSGFFRRRMWCCYHALKYFGVQLPTEDKESIAFWRDKVSQIHGSTMTRDMWSDLVRARATTNGKLTSEERAEDELVTHEAAVACLYFDTIQELPPLH